MPHLIVEYSGNVIEKDRMPALFHALHPLLVEILPTQLSHCKSRAVEATSYYLQDGEPQHAFIHLTLKIMPGRSQDTLKQLSDAMLNVINDHFSKTHETLNLDISLEIVELSPYYFKA